MCNQQSTLFLFGISNNILSLRDESKEEIYDDQLNKALSNQLSNIFIEKNSCVKVLYKAPNLVLLCKTSGNTLKDRDVHLLTNFELPFYAFNMQTINKL